MNDLHTVHEAPTAQRPGARGRGRRAGRAGRGIGMTEREWEIWMRYLSRHHRRCRRCCCYKEIMHERERLPSRCATAQTAGKRDGRGKEERRIELLHARVGRVNEDVERLLAWTLEAIVHVTRLAHGLFRRIQTLRASTWCMREIDGERLEEGFPSLQV